MMAYQTDAGSAARGLLLGSEFGRSGADPVMVTDVVNRVTCALVNDNLTRPEAELACSAVLEVLRPVLRLARTDAYSDYRDAPPPTVGEAQQWLCERGEQDHRRGALF